MVEFREVIRKANIYPLNATPHIANHIENEVAISVATWLTQFKRVRCLDCGAINPDGEHNGNHTFTTEYVIPFKIVQALNREEKTK